MAAAAVTATGLAGAACSGPADAADGGAIRIEGAFGSTLLPRPPQRVVTLGLDPDADTVFALGVAPVAMSRVSSLPGGIAPWTVTGSPPPRLLDTTSGTPFEDIVALAPDLIVATTSYSLAADHAKLARIAPVLAYVTGPNTDRWQDSTRRIGTALARPAAAERMVGDVEAQITRARAGNPSLAGRTFTFGPVTPDGAVYTTRTTGDLSAAFLQQLGLVLAPQVQALPPSATPGKALISPERLDLLDADLVVLTYTSEDPALRARTESESLFSRLPAVRRGSYVAVDLPTALAMAFPSAPSLTYALGHVVDRLATAVH
jgi:iron complex transport system substrate-binding protein